MEWLSTISLAMGSAWTSGINLYATVFILGIFQKLGFTRLPGELAVLDNWWIIGIAGFLYAIEFVADKIPYVDSVWDVVHTFIRVPAGAVMAYAAVAGFNDPAIQIVAFLLGGTVAFSSHGTKTATRAFANLSPEPVSNWILSLVEDFIAIVGAILAIFAPILIGVVVVLFLAVFLLLAPRIFRLLRRIFAAIGRFFGGTSNLETAFRKS